MTTEEILRTNDHRPWEIPQEKWKLYHEWHNVLFFHWETKESEIRSMVPEELEIDVFDGAPWISLVIFQIKNSRPRYLPAFPPISNFAGINIRTYVKYNNKTGIYFFSLEAGKRISGLLGKTYSELPYRYSDIEYTETSYTSRNKELEASLEIEYEIKKRQIDKTDIDRWLTERYAFFQDNKKGRINELEIHHREWPLTELAINKYKTEYAGFRHLMRDKPQLHHSAPEIQVLAWGKKKHKP